MVPKTFYQAIFHFIRLTTGKNNEIKRYNRNRKIFYK